MKHTEVRTFREGEVTLALHKETPPDLMGQLQKFLEQETKQAWIVHVASDEAKETLLVKSQHFKKSFMKPF